jgi:3-(3-hydroxy-phenyl)propionate hydroxylase
VPPMTKGLLALDHPACGTLFPQPWLRQDFGRVLMDARYGAGWRLVVDGRHEFELSEQASTDAGSIGMRTIVIAPDDGPPRADNTGAPARECDGVAARWFDSHGCRAAVIRPDHYVYGVAVSSASLTTLTGRLVHHLYHFA